MNMDSHAECMYWYRDIALTTAIHTLWKKNCILANCQFGIYHTTEYESQGQYTLNHKFYGNGTSQHKTFT